MKQRKNKTDNNNKKGQHRRGKSEPVQFFDDGNYSWTTKNKEDRRKALLGPAPPTPTTKSITTGAVVHGGNDIVEKDTTTEGFQSQIPASIELKPIPDEVSAWDPTVILDKSHPAKWAITFKTLLDVDKQAKKLFGASYPRKTMRHINEAIIIPRCRETGTSYALSESTNGHKVGAFITHCWDEPFCDFVKSIKTAFHPFNVKPNLWICAFALVQGDTSAVKESLQTPLEESPFVLALRQATWFVVVRNAKRDLYSRSWCVCELLFAKKFGFTTGAKDKLLKSEVIDDDDDEEEGTVLRNATMVIGPDKFSSSRTSCVDAEATDEEDRKKILKLLQEEHTVEEVDSLVQEYREYGNHPGEEDGKSWRSIASACGWVLLVAAIVAIIVILATVIPSIQPGEESETPIPYLKTEAPTASSYPTISLSPTNLPSSSPSVSPTPVDYAFLDSFSVQAIENNTFSPQYHALRWMKEEYPRFFSNADFILKRQVFGLVTFYFSTGGETNWTTNARGKWLDPDAYAPVPCDWPWHWIDAYNPDCVSVRLEDSKGKLFQRLNYIDSNLVGTIPPEVSYLGALTSLDLSNNYLYSSIPTQIGLMLNLQKLNLTGNDELSGTIPTELGLLNASVEWSLYNTSLFGDIPSGVCSFPNLNAIYVNCSRVVCPPCNISCFCQE